MNQYPEYGNVSKEIGAYLANIERVHRSAGAGNAAFCINKTQQLYSALSLAAKKELEELRMSR